jgi:hypothetical protein
MKYKLPRQACGWLALSTLACGGALAQSSPYYFGGALGVTRNSDVSPLSPGKSSDTITTATLLAGVDETFGRQRLNASASLRHNNYADNSDLNHLAHDLKARLDFATVDRISGSLSAGMSQLRDLGLEPSTATLERVLSRSQNLGAALRMGVVTRFTVEGTLDHREQDFKRKSSSGDPRDYTLTTGGLSFRYSANPDLTLGTGLRLGDGRYTATDIDFKRRDLDLLATWRPSGASSLNARLSASKINYQPAGISDFSGLTGDVAWDWQPTGKIRLVSRLSRDNRDTAGELASSTDTSRVSTGLSVTADYELSAKVALTAAGGLTQRTLEDIVPNQTTQRGRDRVYALSVGARWTPLRVLTLSCDVSKNQRTVSQSGGTTTAPLTVPYKYDTFGCAAQVVLQ